MIAILSQSMLAEPVGVALSCLSLSKPSAQSLHNLDLLPYFHPLRKQFRTSPSPEGDCLLNGFPLDLFLLPFIIHDSR